MPRIARVVVPGLPHHVTQRGNRLQRTFFSESDSLFYRRILSEWCRRCGVDIWGYCLMPNHVHLIAVPETETGLRLAIGETHKRYTRMVNARKGWKGHLWQGRFFSYPLDETYLLIAVRHIELNPVRAGLVDEPEQYPWSSARSHLLGKDDGLVTVRPLLKRVAGWEEFLALPTSSHETQALKRHEKSGRPLGDSAFVRTLEIELRRTLVKQKPGPKSVQLFPEKA